MLCFCSESVNLSFAIIIHYSLLVYVSVLTHGSWGPLNVRREVVRLASDEDTQNDSHLANVVSSPHKFRIHFTGVDSNRRIAAQFTHPLETS